MNSEQTTIDATKPLLTKRQYAELWAVSSRTVDSWISTGVVRVIRRGRVVRIVNDLVGRNHEAQASRGEAEVHPV